MPGRTALATLLSRVRWALVALGLGQALLTFPAPAARPAALLTLAAVALYNLPVSLARRLPPRVLEPILLVSLVGDYLACTAWLLLSPGATFAIYVLLVLEGGLLYEAGALAVAGGVGLTLTAVALREGAPFSGSFPAGGLLARTAILLMVAVVAARLAAERRQMKRHVDEAQAALTQERETLRQATSERDRAMEALRASGEGLRTIVRSAPVMLFALDQAGTVTLSEGVGLPALGQRTGEAVGWSVYELYGHDASMLDAIRRALSGQAVQTTTEEAGRSFAMSRGPLRDGSGQLAGAIGVALDITDRQQVEAELRQSMDRLRQIGRERQALLDRLIRVQEEERRRIANDIHDDSIQSMIAVGMRLHVLRSQVGAPDQVQSLARLATEVEAAVDRLRHLLFELRPAVLDEEGLAPALRLYLEEMKAQVPLDYRIDSRLGADPTPEARVLLYRIAQEALANVRKHARASYVELTLEEREKGFFLRIRDDGLGFALQEHPAPTPGHLGLVAMRERAAMAGGWLHLDSTPGAGTQVEVWIPAELTAQLDVA
jgi:PAS domain S-box-containing protein